MCVTGVRLCVAARTLSRHHFFSASAALMSVELRASSPSAGLRSATCDIARDSWSTQATRTHANMGAEGHTAYKMRAVWTNLVKECFDAEGARFCFANQAELRG